MGSLTALETQGKLPPLLEQDLRREAMAAAVRTAPPAAEPVDILIARAEAILKFLQGNG